MTKVPMAIALLGVLACGESPPPAPSTPTPSRPDEPSQQAQVAEPSPTTEGPDDQASEPSEAGEPGSIPPEVASDVNASQGSHVAAPGAIDEIVFHFQDASVPPPHHRSYTLRATPNEIRRVVDSYGDIISDQRAPLSRTEFDALVAAVQKHRIAVVPDSTGTLGCSGGTARSFKLLANGQPVLTGQLERCGGKDSGNLRGDLDAMERELSAKAPAVAGPK